MTDALLQLFAEGGDASADQGQPAAQGEPTAQAEAVSSEQPDAAVQAHWRRVEGIYRNMVQEAESLREVFPDFDVRRELHDRRFLGMLRAGVDMASAYQALHASEILPAALRYGAEYARSRLAGWVASGRPEENGVSGGGGVRMGSSVGTLTRSDYEQICRRVAQGEKISFG